MAEAWATAPVGVVCKKDISMKLSARNILTGTVTAVETGNVTTHVKIDIGGGTLVTSSITNEAAIDLALKVGDTACAIIKASDVIVGKE